eukprot:6197464-Pleurochrysis_carterae.AAC.2
MQPPCPHAGRLASAPSPSRRPSPSQIRVWLGELLSLLKIKNYSWGCDLVVGIETRQLLSLLNGAVGARGGLDRNPAYWIRAWERGGDS